MHSPRQAAANAPRRRTLLRRRRFLQTATAAGLGLTILPTGTRDGPDAPSDKLNIALIGCWGSRVGSLRRREAGECCRAVRCERTDNQQR